MDLESIEVPLSEKDESDSLEKSTYDFDTILEYIGDMGKYQALLAVFVIYLTLPVGMHEVGAVFLLAEPKHRCYITGVDDVADFSNCSEQQVLSFTTPRHNEEYDGCKMYDHNYTGSCCDQDQACIDLTRNWSTKPCESYVYSNDVYEQTVVSEWDLVCDKLILGATANAAFFAGGLVGSLSGGLLCDNFGRLTMVLIGSIITLSSGITCAFSPSLELLMAMRFVLSFSISITYAAGFVYVMEIIGGKWRVIVGAVYNAGYAVGYTVLSPMAYTWKNWRDLQLAMTVLTAPFLLMWIAMPESPRWLFAKRRNVKGVATSNLIANRNGKVIPDDIWFKSLKESPVSKSKYNSILTLFRKPGIRTVTLIMIVCWFAVSLTYFGLSLNVGSFSGDVYINNVLSGLCEIAAAPFATLVMKKLGRRISISASFLCAGFMCIAASVINYCFPDYGIIGTALALCGKLAISITYTIMYVFTSELYPTVVRATAVSLGSSSALTATVITPYTLYLQHHVSWLPGIVLGVASMVAGCASLRLKETRGHKLMSTLAEAEAFYSAGSGNL